MTDEEHHKPAKGEPVFEPHRIPTRPEMAATLRAINPKAAIEIVLAEEVLDAVLPIYNSLAAELRAANGKPDETLRTKRAWAKWQRQIEPICRALETEEADEPDIIMRRGKPQKAPERTPLKILPPSA